MKLVVIFLNKLEQLEDLLSAFIEIGVSGATVVNSVGMGHIVTENIPIFAGLRQAFAGTSPSNRTIFSVVEDEKVEDIANVLEDVCGSFDEPGAGVMVAVEIAQVYGYRQRTDR